MLTYNSLNEINRDDFSIFRGIFPRVKKKSSKRIR